MSEFLLDPGNIKPHEWKNSLGLDSQAWASPSPVLFISLSNHSCISVSNKQGSNNEECGCTLAVVLYQDPALSKYVEYSVASTFCGDGKGNGSVLIHWYLWGVMGGYKLMLGLNFEALAQSSRCLCKNNCLWEIGIILENSSGCIWAKLCVGKRLGGITGNNFCCHCYCYFIKLDDCLQLWWLQSSYVEYLLWPVRVMQ